MLHQLWPLARKGERTMAEYESIISKLKTYLINDMGFEENEDCLSKELENEEDFIISDEAILGINAGKLYGGNRAYMYSCIEENFIIKIEETFEEKISLNEQEKTWLTSSDDEIYGTDIISNWIWETCNVTVNKAKADMYVESILGKHAASVA